MTEQAELEVLTAFKKPQPYQLIKIVPEVNHYETDSSGWWFRCDTLKDFVFPHYLGEPKDGDYLVVTPKGKLMFIRQHEVSNHFAIEDNE